MNNSAWQQAKRIFDEARKLPFAERTMFIERSCSGDEELRTQVEKLLVSYDSDFLEDNVLEAANALISPVLAQGQVIGKYRTHELIGSGGMGQVFRAEDMELNRPVAFKVLHKDVAEDKERVRRFIQEARAASALNHPNILTIHEIGSFEGSSYIVSEYIDGETLRECMQRGLTTAESIDITCQIAAALEAAHSAGIVHRDIKPENVMFRKDGLVKVLDFGLAKLTEGDDSPMDSSAPVSRIHTSPGLVMGTVAYMSPEQARGLSVDARSDLWSLGVVLYEMLTGKSPFEGETVTELIASILKTEDAPLHFATLPGELHAICTKALAKDKELRYRSAHDLLKDLKGEKKKMEYAIEPMPYVNFPGKNAELKTKLIRRRPTLSAEYIVTGIKTHKHATLFATLAATLVIGLSVYRYNGATPKLGNKVVLPVITSSTTEKDLKMSRLATSSRVFDIAISPDGKYVAYVGGETRDKSPIRLRERDTGNEVELVPAPNGGHLYEMSFTPDGKYLYYCNGSPGGAAIYRVPTSGGAPPAKVVSDSDGGASVSPDGRVLFFDREVSDGGKGKDAEDFLVANADGTNERVILHTPWDKPSWMECDGVPAWSPDGKKVACERKYKQKDEEYYRLIAINISDGSEELLSDKKWWDVIGRAWLANGDLVIVAKESTADQMIPFQLWLISPGTPPKQVTNGLAGFQGLTATSKGDVLASVQSNTNFDLWLLPQNDASRAKQITSSGELWAGLEWMPDGRIIFASRVSGNVDLWTMNPDGTGRKQLTSGASRNAWPVASHDGRYIVFGSNRLSRFDDHIFRMDADGRNVKQLTNGLREWSPKISPDSKWVYYIQVANNAPFTICKVSIDGGQPTVLATVPEGKGRTDVIDVAPDGRSIVFEKSIWVEDHRERTLYIIPSTGGKPTIVIKLPLTAAEPLTTYFRWTPDGESFAFNDSRDGGANIWTIPANGKGQEKPLTNFGRGPGAFRFTWSPDGKQLLVTRVTQTSDGILISNSER
ncbi:MAG: hypothetical protein C5B55_11985 [Blastocatellia bacterium]|nr:MAG: hypothetical protein C5B55_11985 [Blastocatellia bacterium]